MPKFLIKSIIYVYEKQSIITCCDPNAAKVSLMHCYEAWKVEDLEEDSE